MKPKYISLSSVFLVSFLAALSISIKTGLNKPLESDAEQFRSIAVNVAAGNGYRSDATFWPDQPTLQRMPGWPMTIVPFLWVTPHSCVDAVMRILCCALNAAVAVFICIMAQHLTGRWVVASVAGLLYGLHPVGLFLTAEAASEMLFLALVTASLVLMVWHPRRRPIAIMLAALACLERANFVLWFPVWVGLALLVSLGWKRRWLNKRNVGLLVVFALLFAVPSGAWVARNATITGRFPVLSTLRGQTFYGGNNPVVADDLGYWGYWVFPNQVPGETPLVDLALKKGMSEYEVDCYYQQKGIDFIKGHWFAMPRLLLGKFIRAYVPVPWKPSWGSYAVSAYRWLIDVLALAGLLMCWRKVSPQLWIHLLSFFVVNLVTVMAFWGNYRFAFAFEPFLIPFAAVALVASVGRLSAGRAWPTAAPLSQTAGPSAQPHLAHSDD